MSTADWLILFFVVLCLLGSFFFSGAETALTATSRATMLHLAKEGNPKASVIARLLEARDDVIGAILVGNNVATITASTLATDLMIKWFGNRGLLVVTVTMTVLVVVFCEVLPKTAAINAPDRIALRIARPIAGVVRVFTPVLAAVYWLVDRILAAFGYPVGASKPILTPQEELRGQVDLLHREGSVEKLDRDMLGGLLDLNDLTVADVMIHRTEVIMVDAGKPPQQAVEEVLAAPVTRVPLWRDTPENIIGVLHAKDLLHALRAVNGDPAKLDLAQIVRPPWFVPEIRSLSEQLKAFRRRKTPFALVVDEYGEMMGIVTLEDILEEIVGDITDEHDVAVPGVRPQPDGSVNVDGAVPIRDLNRVMDWNLPDEEATTIAGLVIHEARLIPDPGQSFTFHGFRFRVLRRERNRITALRITPVATRIRSARAAG
ncbi:MAG TPA: HlyC/CorC family transporter [Xanthobacteraceae bacterium]|nr:HlyC/CorC family transporter [Xanthobacteraceae bacterium]